MKVDYGHRLLAAYKRRRPWGAALMLYCFYFTAFTIWTDFIAGVWRPMDSAGLRYVLPLPFVLPGLLWRPRPSAAPRGAT